MIVEFIAGFAVGAFFAVCMLLMFNDKVADTGTFISMINQTVAEKIEKQKYCKKCGEEIGNKN